MLPPLQLSALPALHPSPQPGLHRHTCVGDCRLIYKLFLVGLDQAQPVQQQWHHRSKSCCAAWNMVCTASQPPAGATQATSRLHAHGEQIARQPTMCPGRQSRFRATGSPDLILFLLVSGTCVGSLHHVVPRSMTTDWHAAYEQRQFALPRDRLVRLGTFSTCIRDMFGVLAPCSRGA